MNSKLRKVLEETPFLVLPGVYDALSAKLAEEAAAKAVFLSGASLAIANLGRPDIGYLSMSDFVDSIQKITSTVDIPLLADADNGFGNAIHAGNTARLYEKAGASGIQIDDQILPQLMPTTSKVALEWNLVEAKIKAVRKNTSDDFVIIFRTITNGTDGVDEAIKRINMSKKIGADYAYVDGLKSLEELETVAAKAEIKLLVNMNERGVAANIPIKNIKELGYRIGLYPVSTMVVAAKSMKNMLDDLMKDEDTLKHREQMYNPVEIYNMMGLADLTEEYLKLYN